MSTVQQEACLQPVGMAVPLKKVRPPLDIVAIYNRDGKVYSIRESRRDLRLENSKWQDIGRMVTNYRG